jgi:hypothetical protein
VAEVDWWDDVSDDDSDVDDDVEDAIIEGAENVEN